MLQLHNLLHCNTDKAALPISMTGTPLMDWIICTDTNTDNITVNLDGCSDDSTQKFTVSPEVAGDLILTGQIVNALLPPSYIIIVLETGESVIGVCLL